MLKLHRCEHRNKIVDHCRIVILENRIDISSPPSLELNWKLVVNSSLINSISSVEITSYADISLQSMRPIDDPRFPPVCWKIEIFAENVRTKTIARLQRYFLRLWGFNTLDYWGIGGKFKRIRVNIHGTISHVSLLSLPRLAEFGTRPHGWQIVHTSAQVPPQWPN